MKPAVSRILGASLIAVATEFSGLAGCGANDWAATLPVCPPIKRLSGAPSTIADVVALANAMQAEQQQPVTLPCFVERLDRPLAVLPVLSPFSLQPGEGARSPRVFLFSGNIVMSVAPAGTGQDRLELAEYTSPTRSIKAEIAFPVAATIAPSNPYDRVLRQYGPGTICGGCHLGEQPATVVANANAFESEVFRPRTSEEVSIPYLQDQTRTCDPTLEPERCSLLTALFGRGEVTVRQFSADAPTIYGD